MKKFKTKNVRFIITLLTVLMISFVGCSEDNTLCCTSFETDYYIGKYFTPEYINVEKNKTGYNITLGNKNNFITPDINRSVFIGLAEKHHDKKDKKNLSRPPEYLPYGISSISIYKKRTDEDTKEDLSNSFEISFESMENFMIRDDKKSYDNWYSLVTKKVDKLTKNDLNWIPISFDLKLVEEINLSSEEAVYINIELDNNTSIEKAIQTL